MKKSNLEKGFSSIIILLLVITAGLIGFKTYQQFIAHQKDAPKKTLVKQALVRRSKIPNIITNATTAKAIDVKTGKVITAARVFSLDDKTVYLALDLDQAKSGTFIDYIRYLNGRYVDHGNAKIIKDATENISFNWTNSKALGSITEGNWKIATYTNGILEKRVNYIVKKDQVSYQFLDDDISFSNSDYQLDNTLALISQAN